MNRNLTPRDYTMIQAAIRRVFSRSPLRQRVMDKVKIVKFDPNRPKVKNWSRCPKCQQDTPTYQMQCDHIEPVVRIGEALQDLSIDLLVERVFCHEYNLMPLCLTCHKAKSSIESGQRAKLKKEKKNGTSS